MRIPVITGWIDRRILVNYRVDPEVMAKYLPEPFEPQLVDGYGVAGGSIELDHALLMKDIEHEWHDAGSMN